jgi:Spy/CpxP family protein refolding chaperone
MKGIGRRRTTNITEWRSNMKRATKIAIGVGTALTLGLAAAVVSAHPHGYGPGYGMGQGPGYGMGMGYGPGPGMGRGMGARGYGNPGAMADGRLAYLKSELKITSAQETAWKAFADSAKQQAEAMQALRTTMQGSTQATAPERMELRNKIMKQRQEQVEKSTAAFKDLYAALAPEQKTIADQRFGAGRGYGPGHRGGPGGRFR